MILKDKRIFIVEDNMQNRLIFQMALIRQGASVDFERWGRDTLYHLQNMSHIDLIILDLMLADGISGLDLFDQIRQVPKYSALPIIAVSAMDPSIAIPKTRAKGFSGFIAKPIDNILFPKQLVSILNGEKVWSVGERTL
ncbi:MAG: response regulator [Chloroflexi bacterium]|nr:response regulator [Chloroflexota bacterium]MCC6897234.1 response regulator [Anaerolineae bacterium]